MEYRYKPTGASIEIIEADGVFKEQGFEYVARFPREGLRGLRLADLVADFVYEKGGPDLVAAKDAAKPYTFKATGEVAQVTPEVDGAFRQNSEYVATFADGRVMRLLWSQLADQFSPVG
jgi:hypothetical protein